VILKDALAAEKSDSPKAPLIHLREYLADAVHARVGPEPSCAQHLLGQAANVFRQHAGVGTERVTMQVEIHALDKKMVVEDIDEHARHAAPLGRHEGFASFNGGMGIGEAIQFTMKADAESK